MFFKMRSAYSVAAICSVLTVATVASARYKCGKQEILVHAKGPGMGIEGKSPKLIIEEGDKSVTFKTFLNTINTGNGMRNDHMQERFEAAKYPEIKLVVDKDKIDDKKGGTVPAMLTFHGVTKPVKVKYEVKGKRVNATFGINVTDYGIDKDKLCAFHVCADSAVGIEVNFELQD